MNQQERDELLRFLQPLLRSRAADKDFVAETLILEQCARQPDALYLLVQRAMALQSALAAAQARLAELQARDAAGAAPVTQTLTRPPGDAWGRGLRAQAAALTSGVGTAVGVAAGVAAGMVAGGLLLDAIDSPADGLLGDMFGADV